METPPGTNPSDILNPGTAIHRLSAVNFRSFEDVVLDFGRLNVFIGPNASGKSNVLLALRFLRDLASDGLEDAIGLQGGIELLANVRKREQPVELEVAFSSAAGSRFIESLFTTKNGAPIRYGGPRSTYYLSIRSNGKQKYKVTQDRLVMHFAFSIESSRSAPTESRDHAVTLTLETRDDFLDFKFDTPDWANLEASPLLEYVARQPRSVPSQSTVFDQAAGIFDFRPSAFFKDIPIFDFEPDLAREAIFIEGKARLNDDGENLPIVLRRLFEDEENRIAFRRLLKSLLPYIADIDVETYSDMTSTINVSEAYKGPTLPASALSTGTIDIAALIAAIYFEESPVIALEEPERYIHAALISRVASLLKDRMDQRQFFITTHDSRMIKELSDATIYALYRDKLGYSRAVNPRTSPLISKLLTDELGLDDLNAVGLLHE